MGQDADGPRRKIMLKLVCKNLEQRPTVCRLVCRPTASLTAMTVFPFTSNDLLGASSGNKRQAQRQSYAYVDKQAVVRRVPSAVPQRGRRAAVVAVARALAQAVFL
jgi:hypothetical protein